MTGHLKPYPSYRDSGIPWLGDVPEHWEIHSLGSMTKARSQRGQPDLPLLSVVREKGVVLRSSMSDDENHNYVPDDLSNYKVVREGDLVINKMKAWQGSLGLAPTDGVVSPAYFVFDFGIDNRRFGQYLLRSKPYVSLFAQASDGVRIGQWDLSPHGMKRIPVVVPTAPEQSAIVRFLDEVDRRIRRYMRAKQRLIRLLEEQKQAIIYRTVTRGLNPADVRLKPSGVEWLGDIPEHWKVMRLGRLVTLTTGFPFKSAGFTESPDDIRLLRGINISPGQVRWNDVVRWPSSERDDFCEYELEPDDIVLGMDRPIIRGGVRVAVLEASDVPAFLLQRVARIRPRRVLITQFSFLLLSGKSFADYLSPIFTGISVPHLSPEQIKSFQLALPSIDEQEQIVTHLTVKVGRISALLEHANSGIALAREYRTRLIADVVTGKLDVREAAARLPDEVEEPDDLLLLADEDDAELPSDELAEQEVIA